MARKVRIELLLDDNGMARTLQVDKNAVVQLDDAIDDLSGSSKRFGQTAQIAFGTLAATAIASAANGILNLARGAMRKLHESVKLAGRRYQ